MGKSQYYNYNPKMKFFKNIISGIVDKRVDERINELVKSDDFFTLRDVPDNEAKGEISDFILKERDSGNTQLTTLDFVLKLKIQGPQVEKILDKFESENKIEEVDA